MKTVNTLELKEWQKQAKKFIILDVRSKSEYEEGHIPGSLLVPLDILEKEFLNKLTDKSETIVCVCHSGTRSALATNFLESQGYTNVYNLVGGFMVYNMFEND
ncbi:MAG: rhodanese-like domain-containing protein [Candidatus Magasanikbacteria bacterium]